MTPSIAIPVPSDYPELALRPALREMLQRQADMQFADLGVLLQLPRADADLHAGTNLTTTIVLCNIIAGASVLFYESSLDAVQGRRNNANPLGSGQRFREVLDFFPWEDPEVVPRRIAVDALYKYARNPLAHSLGVGKAPALLPGLRGKNVMLAKRPLPAAAVAEVLRGDAVQPLWFDMHIVSTDQSGYVISVEGLAWGVCRMIRSLFADVQQVERAEHTAEQLLGGAGSLV
jgi:hypothetical protein